MSRLVVVLATTAIQKIHIYSSVKLACKTTALSYRYKDLDDPECLFNEFRWLFCQSFAAVIKKPLT